MIYETEFLGKPLKVQTKFLASQASGSALVSFGKTVVLGTATMSDKEIEADFFPLTVDYEERFYASGKIKGSRFVRREGRPSEEAILVARMIDRAIRPYFPKNFKREVQVVLTVFAFDGENDPDFPALIAASTALSISEIPWDGPVAGLRVAKISEEEKIVFSPTYNQRDKASFDFFVSGIKDIDEEILFNMIDGEGEEIKEEEVLSSFDEAKGKINKLINFQKDIVKKEGKKKIDNFIALDNIEELYKKYKDKIEKNFLLLSKEGEEKKKESTFAQQKLMEEAEMDFFTFEVLAEKVLHEMIIQKDLRPDGRKLDEIREIKIAVGVLPQTHGSGLFCRGLTQILSTLTLGAPGDELLLEGMEIEGKKRFLHHYNFPPYSVGETGRIGAPGRREIGHGALAEKALRPVVPMPEEFPYTIRIVSEALSSNGSTSMASVCASSLALFDAGVKIKRPVAGISCGLMMEDYSDQENNFVPISKRKYKILTDIQGPEDSMGDMDFKVAGTEKGITAVQLDIKIKGLTIDILKEGFKRAKDARIKILQKMAKTLSSPRSELSPLAPSISTIKINPEKIREVIGPGGKMINSIIEETEASIDIEDSGMVFVTAENKEKAQKAINWIKNIAREFKKGERFDGKVKRIMDFGIFIELLPNQDGLLHISSIAKNLKPIEKNFKIGQIVQVKIKNIDDNGKISLEMLS